MTHHQHHQPHAGGHHHGGTGAHAQHRDLALASPSRLGSLGRRVHLLGRRRFLVELGRKSYAVAILGGLVAACSSGDDAGSGAAADDDAARTVSGDEPAATTEPGPNDTATSPSTADSSGATAADPGSGEQVDSLEWARVNLGFVSAYVLVRGNDAAVVDTGVSGSADQIGETLGTLGLTYDNVRHVVLTHAHPDHIGSLPAVVERAPSAPAYAGQADIASIGATAVTAVGDGDDVFGLEIIETPGHTPGSISLLDTDIGLLVAGDALNGNGDGSAIAGPNPEFSRDMVVARESVTKLAGFSFETAVFWHGEPFEGGAGEAVSALAASQ